MGVAEVIMQVAGVIWELQGDNAGGGGDMGLRG